jgi:hypothetical protein
MNKMLEIELFLSGILTGSKATQQRHLAQARAMQEAIQKRWQRNNPWTWKTKHIHWFFNCHMKNRSTKTRYYYKLTTQLIQKRTGRSLLPKTYKNRGGEPRATNILQQTESRS